MLKLIWQNIVQYVLMVIKNQTVGSNAIKYATSKTVERANLVVRTNVSLVNKDINLRPQIKVLLFVQRISVIFLTVLYVTLLVILVINVLTIIMFGMLLLKHVFLINVNSKIVINVKQIQQNVNNVKVGWFYLFRVVDVCNLRYKIAKH